MTGRLEKYNPEKYKKIVDMLRKHKSQYYIIKNLNTNSRTVQRIKQKLGKGSLVTQQPPPFPVRRFIAILLLIIFTVLIGAMIRYFSR